MMRKGSGPSLICITGAPEGIYYLVHYADPDNHWLETDEFNNLAWVKFSLSSRG
jgi:hypothetical protein